MNKIIDKQNRCDLTEGRNYSIGYAFCKRKSNTYTTIQPISPCKDYLNDIVFSEQTGKPCSAYGLKTTKKNIFEEYKHNYIVIKICKKDAVSQIEYSNYKKDVNNLNKNYKNIESFINYFEEVIFGKNVTNKTKIVKTNIKDLYLIRVNKKWCETTYGISLFSFLVRLSLQYNNKIDPLMFFYKGDHNSSEKYKVNSASKALVYFIKNRKIDNQDFKKLCSKSSGDTKVHDYGINAFVSEKKLK